VRRLHDETRPDPKSLLVALPAPVGDVVMATPTLQAIRERFPRTRITYLLRPATRELVHASPWMDDVIEWPARDRRGRQSGTLRLGAQLRRHRFDWAVLLTNSFRSALVTRLAGIRRRIGYDRDGRGWMLTDRVPVQRENGQIARTRMVDYYGHLGWLIGCERPTDRLVLHTASGDDNAIADQLAAAGLTDHRPLVVMTPGASFGPSKLWPAERFAAVCDRLVDELQARVVVTHGPAENDIAARAIHAMQHAPLVMGPPRLTLGQLMALVRRCDLLLCNDTGPRHFAKAFGLPVVTVFGPTWPDWTDTDYPDERKVRIDVSCGPCQKPVCPEEHHDCMTGVTVDAVFTACRDLLVRRLATAE
jgi:heptosyltransferase-2